jgi:hypothetical protein
MQTAQHRTFGCYYPSNALTSSNQRESVAVLRGLRAFSGVFKSAGVHALTIRSNNAVTVYNLQRQGAGTTLLALTHAFFSFLLEYDIRIHIRHIPGVENVLTDALSSLEKTGNYALRPDVFQHVIMTLEVR